MSDINKMGIEQLKIRLKSLFGDLVTLKDGQQYIKMISPIIFIDKDYGEWTTSPNNVLNKGCVHPTRKQEKRKATNLKKYGVDNPFKNEDIKTKIKDTLTEKYGGDHPMHCESIRKKAEETCLKNHGVKYSLQNKEILARTKETLLERYGVEHAMHIDSVKEKYKATSLERYGVENPHQHSKVIEKTKETNNERYGGNAPACSPEIIEKIKETNLIKYGGAPICSPEIKAKISATNLERYGAENPFGAEDIKKKIAEINIERYGVPHPAQNPDVIKKIEATCLERYGAKSPLESLEVLNKIKEKPNDLEKAMSRLLNIEHYNGVVTTASAHRKPDFKLSDDLYLEIDGLYWHSEIIKPYNYHVKKRIDYESIGVRILQFRKDELDKNPDVIKSIINNFLGKNTSIDAEKCCLASIECQEANAFLEKNHLLGRCQKKEFKACGLIEENIGLICLICFTASGDEINILRFSMRNEYCIDMAFEYLLNYLIQSYKPGVIRGICDLRYETGENYDRLGFTKIVDFQGWVWTDFINTFIEDEDKKLCRIYDAGQRLYMKVLT